MINMEQLRPRQFVSVFKGRTDRIVLYARNKVRLQEIKVGEFEIVNRAEAHIGGQVRMGFYNMLDDNTIPWAVVNFLEGEASKNIARDSMLLTRELTKLGLRGVRRERTMSPAQEYNVWIFFDPPIVAKKVRFFLFTFFEKLGLSKSIPIIPVTDELNPGSFGQHVWVPYFNGIDYWFNSAGEKYVCKGIKDEQTVFIDNDGKVIERSILSIPRSSESDLDQALLAISGPLGKKYLPGVGLYIQETSFLEMSKRCVAIQNIIKKIEETGFVSEDGLMRLATTLRAFGMEKLLQKYISKLREFDANKFENSFSQFTGNVFPTCLDFKQVDFCPAGKNCFPKRAPVRERMGNWKEDPSAEKNLEPTNAPWLYKVVAEQLEEAAPEEGAPEEGAAEEEIPTLDEGGEAPRPAAPRPPMVKLELVPLKDFVNNYEMKLTNFKDSQFANQRTVSGWTTGFDILNEAIDGLKPGTLVALLGSPGSGKSSFAKQIFDTVADKEKVPCIYFSYDLSAEQLHRKTLARLSGVNLGSILKGVFSGEDWGKIAKVNSYVREAMGKLVFIVEADGNLNITGIESAIEKSQAKFAVIDFFQAIPPLPRVASLEADERYRAILIDLKNLARKFDIPIMAISNGNLTNSMEYCVDIQMLLYSQTNPAIASTDKQPLAVILNVDKNREGKSMVSLQFTFFPPRMTYYGEKRIDYRQIKL